MFRRARFRIERRRQIGQAAVIGTSLIARAASTTMRAFSSFRKALTSCASRVAGVPVAPMRIAGVSFFAAAVSALRSSRFADSATTAA